MFSIGIIYFSPFTVIKIAITYQDLKFELPEYEK